MIGLGRPDVVPKARKERDKSPVNVNEVLIISRSTPLNLEYVR